MAFDTFHYRQAVVFSKVQLLRTFLPISDEFESRRLWEKVTINLKANNIDKATEGKRALEDRQRQEAKERLEKSITYYPEVSTSAAVSLPYFDLCNHVF